MDKFAIGEPVGLKVMTSLKGQDRDPDPNKQIKICDLGEWSQVGQTSVCLHTVHRGQQAGCAIKK